MIPPIWIVELTRIDEANQKRKKNTTDLEDNFGQLLETIGGETLGNNLLNAVKCFFIYLN